MKKKISVTANDIALGKRGSFCECPIARAVRRAFRAPMDRKVAVRHEGIFVGNLDESRMWLADLPPAAKRFITLFDKGTRSVRPAVFDVTFR